MWPLLLLVLCPLQVLSLGLTAQWLQPGVVSPFLYSRIEGTPSIPDSQGTQGCLSIPCSSLFLFFLFLTWFVWFCFP